MAHYNSIMTKEEQGEGGITRFKRANVATSGFSETGDTAKPVCYFRQQFSGETVLCVL